MDTKGTGQNVRINGVSVLSGVSEKSHGYMFYRYKDEGKRLYGNKTLFQTKIYSFYENLNNVMIRKFHNLTINKK